jgi:hypothetical protein
MRVWPIGDRLALLTVTLSENERLQVLSASKHRSLWLRLKI